MAKILYFIVLGYILLNTSLHLFHYPGYSRKKGFSRWANRIPNHSLWFIFTILLIIYPFTKYANLFESKTSVNLGEQYVAILISIIMFHILTAGVTFIKRVIHSGKSQSFFIHYLQLFNPFKEQSDPRDEGDIYLALEYSLIGTFGGVLGIVLMPSPLIQKNYPFFDFCIFGIALCLLYSVLAKITKAHYY